MADQAYFDELIVNAVKLKPPEPKLVKSRKEFYEGADEEDKADLIEQVIDDNIGIAWSISYENAAKELSHRRVSVKKIYKAKGEMCISAFCHMRKQSRNFRLDRIQEICDIRTGEVIEGSSLIANKIIEVGRILNSDNAENAKNAVKDCREAMNILMFLARCDGKMHPKELEVVMTYVAEQWWEFDLDSKTLQTHAERLYPDTDTYLSSITSIKRKGDKFLKKLRNLSLIHI